MHAAALELLIERAVLMQHAVENIGCDPTRRETGHFGWQCECRPPRQMPSRLPRSPGGKRDRNRPDMAIGRIQVSLRICECPGLLAGGPRSGYMLVSAKPPPQCRLTHAGTNR